MRNFFKSGHRARQIMFLALLLVLLALGLNAYLWHRGVRTRLGPMPTGAGALPQARLTRPYGMAPEAFDAWLRACQAAKVDPFRLTQTIGDDPRSVGYHKRDGVIVRQGRRDDYCAATDIHVWKLNDAQIARLLRTLSEQGFAAWYRHGGKWTGGEHIHAIYALLPMKPQLRGQVRQWLDEQRRAPRWTRKMKRHYRGVQSPFVGPVG